MRATCSGPRGDALDGGDLSGHQKPVRVKEIGADLCMLHSDQDG